MLCLSVLPEDISRMVARYAMHQGGLATLLTLRGVDRVWRDEALRIVREAPEGVWITRGRWRYPPVSEFISACVPHIALRPSVCDDMSYLSTLMLSGVQAFNLSGCWWIEDVSALRGCRNVDLSRCTRLHDVSPLRSAHTLKLSCCTGVWDVSMLGGVYRLNLFGCTGVREVSALGSVYDLNLANCRGLSGLSELGGVHTLSLANTDIISASGLFTRRTGMYYLDLSCCKLLQDVSGLGLGTLHMLNLACCPQVRDVSALGAIHTLILASTRVRDVSMLGGVHTLNLSNTPVLDASMLGHVHTLHLFHCFALRGFPPGYSERDITHSR